MLPTDLAWAAGFIDAEGCFSGAGPTPSATVAQVDLEPLDVFAHTIQVGNINGPYEKATATIKRRPQWVYSAYGEEAQALFELLRPWLGSYRREQGMRVLSRSDERDESTPFDVWPWQERVAWCAGYFEGDGTFSRSSAGLTARAASTNLELVRRLHATIGVGHVYGPYAQRAGRKHLWVYTTSGFEQMQAILAMFWPWLSSRRRLAAMQLLDHYLKFYACRHQREDGPWHKHCPKRFKPGPKPGSERRRAAT